MEQKALLVFFRNTVEEVVGNGELTVQLLKADAIVLQEKKTILSDCPFDIGNQLSLCFFVTIKLGKVNSFKFGEVMLLLCGWRRDPATSSALETNQAYRNPTIAELMACLREMGMKD